MATPEALKCCLAILSDRRGPASPAGLCTNISGEPRPRGELRNTKVRRALSAAAQCFFRAFGALRHAHAAARAVPRPHVVERGYESLLTISLAAPAAAAWESKRRASATAPRNHLGRSS